MTGSLGLWVSMVVLPPSIGSSEYGGVAASQSVGPVEVSPPLPAHLPTPVPVRGVYMSSWVAGTPSIRERLLELIDDTELNTVVIDIKDYTGKISFPTDNPTLLATGAQENRIPDVKELIALLHSKGIYVIGRIAVFQDPYLTTKRPDLAVKKASDGSIWTDYKGAKWLDSSSREVWHYAVEISRESARLGFDEINFDYIRFPSDGNMRDIAYPFFDKLGVSKSENMKQFFVYLREQLDDSGIPLSADFFGMTTTNTDDLNIGQILEDGLIYFDYIAPMIYPSHYPPTFLGYKNPAAHPYEVIKYALDGAVRRAIAIGQPKEKIRPWLQDFNLGATYTAEMVKKQKQATYDSGLDSWLLWDPSNKYTRGALEDGPLTKED